MPASKKEKQSSTDKVLGILNLFTENCPAWTAERLSQELGLTRATTYRYLKALNTAGLVVPGAGGSYVLGPRFIQIDRQIQKSDPLLNVAIPCLAPDDSPIIGAKFICGFYGDQMLSVYVDKRDQDILLTMERGRTFPLFYAAPSKVILAYLPPYHLKAVYSKNAAEIAKAGMGDDWNGFRAVLKAIRRDGYCVGNQLDARAVGVAAPIFHAPNAVSASLCYVRRRDISTQEDLDALRDLVVAAAARISQRLQSFQPNDGAGTPVFPTPRLSR